MLSGRRHDDVTICGSTTLCGNKTTDFRNFQAENGNTDLVGFAFPYCAMGNIRACHVVTRAKAFESIFSAAWHEVVCVLAPFLKVTTLCMKNTIDTYRYSSLLRHNIEKLAFEMPFWREGGVLYIHTPLPHPPGETRSSLKSEYEGNISNAIVLIGKLLSSLKIRFESDFALIITSDHPLRTEWWCKEGYYSSPSCVNFMSSQQDSDVPFIVVAPEKVSVKLPTSNLGVWAAVE